MDDDSKIVLRIATVLSLCGFAAIIYLLYTKVLVFAGGFVVGLIILTPVLSYVAGKFFIWTEQSGSWYGRKASRDARDF